MSIILITPPQGLFSRIVVAICMVGLLISGCAKYSSSFPNPSPGLRLETCFLSSPGTSSRLEARCGTLPVLENAFAKNGRKINLNIAVLPAVSRKPSTDPLFFIPGGPGEAATESYLTLQAAFEQINQKRDIVLVDQRGTGKSNPLSCPASSSEDASTLGSDQIKDWAQNCLAKLDADPRYYTTPYAVSDLDQVREALGYQRVNLYGGSYGTRVALDYLREYPQRVRTVILDGIAPPNWTLGPTASQNAQRSLDLIFQRCSSSSTCNTAFPGLETNFQSIIQNLMQQPVTVTINDPLTGEPQVISVTRSYFANTILNMSYASETMALLPLIIYTTNERKDYSHIASWGLLSESNLGTAISDGMRYSVLCTEDVPYYGTDQVQTGYLGDIFTKEIQDICKVWPRGELPQVYKEPVTSMSPVLLLSGEADPVTPPENGTLAAQTIQNSLHLVIPGQGHINIFRGCLPNIAARFVDTGEIQGLDTVCTQNIQPFPFFLDFTGPQP